MRVHGLDRFRLNENSLRRLGNRQVEAEVNLLTYDVTPAVRRLPIPKRRAYLLARAGRWINSLHRSHPKLSFHVKSDKLPGSRGKRPSQLPYSITATGTARDLVAVAGAAGVSSVYLTKVHGRRRRNLPKSPLEWYCVRAFVVIRVEQATSGYQCTEDRFILVRASSCDDAKNRLRKQWREYARPYLNSDYAMVSWQLDRIVDVYQTSGTEIEAKGTEVYSKLGNRRMRRKYVWRP